MISVGQHVNRVEVQTISPNKGQEYIEQYKLCTESSKLSYLKPEHQEHLLTPGKQTPKHR